MTLILNCKALSPKEDTDNMINYLNMWPSIPSYDIPNH